MNVPQPPIAVRLPVSRTIHGTTLVDDYSWMRAKNWQDVLRDPTALDSIIRAHLDAENAYTAAMLEPVSTLCKQLVMEMRGRIKQDESTVSVPDGPYEYAMRYREGGQHPTIWRRQRGGDIEEVLLDGDKLAQDHVFFRLGGWVTSHNHKLLAYTVDLKGAEMFTVRVRNLETGCDLPDTLYGATGTPVWVLAGLAFFYVRLDTSYRPSRVFLHVIGTKQTADVLVFEETDSRFSIGLRRTQSGAFAVISVHDHETAECHLIDLKEITASPLRVAPRHTRVEYSVEHHPVAPETGGHALYILSNADDADDFAIHVAPLSWTGDAAPRSSWRPVVPHQAGVYILSFVILRDWLIRLERKEGLPRIILRTLSTGKEKIISFVENAYSLWVDAGKEFETDEVRFTYSSMKTPQEVYQYRLDSSERMLLRRQEIPSGHDPEHYQTHRIFAPSVDGELVPISLLYRRGLDVNSGAPCLLYGYGAYGAAMPAAFSISALSLVDRGFVYAIAHVRGGSEKGRQWYRDGKLDKKWNTFHDFITAARHLISEGFTRQGMIIAQGGSAGGMLMGVVANLAPEMFAGIVTEVPFVDVLNTMLDNKLPLTPIEWREWGDPITDARAFAEIHAYSPYENVAPQPYPAILAIAGLLDPRVTYWEPAKWIAKLRAMTTSIQPILLQTNMEAGHGGAAGRLGRLENIALSYAFMLLVSGRNKLK